MFNERKKLKKKNLVILIPDINIIRIRNKYKLHKFSHEKLLLDVSFVGVFHIRKKIPIWTRATRLQNILLVKRLFCSWELQQAGLVMIWTFSNFVKRSFGGASLYLHEGGKFGVCVQKGFKGYAEAERAFACVAYFCVLVFM